MALIYNGFFWGGIKRLTELHKMKTRILKSYFENITLLHCFVNCNCSIHMERYHNTKTIETANWQLCYYYNSSVGLHSNVNKIVLLLGVYCI